MTQLARQKVHTKRCVIQLDKGTANTGIIKQLIALDKSKQITIPPKAWQRIDVFSLNHLIVSDLAQIADVERQINKAEYPFFIDEPETKQAMRRMLKNKNLKSFNSVQSGALEKQKQGYVLPDIYEAGWLEKVQWNRKMGNDLKLFDMTGQWQESQFQRIESFLAHHYKEKTSPNFNLLRLYAHSAITLEGELVQSKSIPWRWFLSDRINSGHSGAVASRVIEIFLDRPIKKHILTDDVIFIEKASRWINDDPSLKWLWTVETIASFTIRQSTLNKASVWLDIFSVKGADPIHWGKLKAAVYFIRHNLNKSPECELLRDWMNGEVNLDGVGQARCIQEGVWGDTNIGAYFSTLEN